MNRPLVWSYRSHRLYLLGLRHVQTVIECLKMASTGDLPPNVKSGQNFIHDPKVAGEVEVKAQIKMRFQVQPKGTFSIIRNFSLKQMRKNLQFKALDQTLSVWNPETGDYNCLPQRCSNINQEVPLTMGVNKAILENVVFVHQEDSNWPLSEPANVKKRFDDIFAATKYTKALEEIKKLKNNRVSEAKDKRLKLETLKSYRDRAHQLVARIAESEQSIKALGDNISVLQEDIEKLDGETKVLEEELGSILMKKEQVSAVKAKYDILRDSLEKMRKAMIEKYSEEDVESPVEELESYRTEYTPRLAQMEASMEEIKKYISEAEAELKTVMLSKEGIMKMYGKIMGEAESHKKAAESIRTIGTDVCTKFGVLIPPSVEAGDLKRDELDAMMDILREKEAALGGEINQAKAKHQQEEAALQSTIDTLNARISANKEAVRLRQSKVKENEVLVENLGRELDALKSDTGVCQGGAGTELSKLEAELTEAKKASAELANEFHSNKDALAIQNADLALRECDKRIKGLRVERSKLTADGEAFMRSKIMLQELDKLVEKEKAFRNRHVSKVAITLGIAPSSITMASQAILQQTKEWIAEKTKEEGEASEVHASLRGKFADMEVLLKSRQKSLDESRREVEALAKSLAGADGASIEEQIKTLRSRREEYMKRINFCDAYVEIWNREKDHAAHQGTCVSCDRGFDGDDAKAAFIAKKQEMINEMPSQAVKAQEDVEELDAKLEDLKLVEPDARRHAALSSSVIPGLTDEVQEASDQLMKVKIDFEAAELDFKSAQESLESSKTLLHEVIMPWSQLLRQIEEQKAVIGNVNENESSAMAAKTIDSIDNELDRAEADRAEAQSARDGAAAKLAALQSRISMSKDAEHMLQEKLRRLGDGQQSKIALETKLAAVMEDSESAANDAAEKSAELKTLEQEKKKLVNQKGKLGGAFQKTQDDGQSELNSLKLAISQLAAIVQHVGNSNPVEMAKQLESSLNGVEQKRASLESRISTLKSELESKTQDHADTQSFASQVTDLLSFKKLEAEFEGVKAEMEAMGVDASMFEREPTIKDQLRLLAKERSAKRSEADISAGSFATTEENMRKYKDELSSAHFVDIDAQYLKQMAEAQSIEIACSDLETYHKALERTLLLFHKSKMDDINRTIKELWQKTYRGVDIDYIQIKTDTETTSTRSSYNYRVVMFVGGAELDMRGRCSAGQKILSCLIIRLALAENFCLNCGVLALDEPTTNLDAENSASLAEALKSLMISRKDFESFQLIVITHDEEFAMRLGTRDNVEYLWRVSKDENQHSRIRREPIT